MSYLDYEPVTGIIRNISRGSDCCSQMISLATREVTVNFVLSPETMVIEGRTLRPGMRVTAFYDRTLPVPLIFPPQYRAGLIAVPERNEQVMLNYFDRNLLAADGSLRLNIGRNTIIRTANGQNFNCSVRDNILLVYYSITTRSIPPQTTPRQIIVMC